jgi:hypothetical protein
VVILNSMKKRKDEFLKKLPSLYDYFYYDFWILKNLCDIKTFDEFISQKNNFLKDNYKGYLFLSELAIIHLINDLEGLIDDDNISELVQWGEVDVQENEIMQYIKKNVHPDFTFLLSFRKFLSTLRYDNFNIIFLNKKLSELKLNLEKLNQEIIEIYKVKRKINNWSIEKKEILNKIVNRYNNVEFDFAFDEKISNKDITPIWLSHPISYLLSPEIMKNYYLQDPNIKTYEGLYSKSCALSLLYLYSKLLSNNQLKKIELKLLFAKNWIDINNIREIFYEGILKRNNSLGVKIFNSEYINLSEKFLTNDEITKKSELKILLRGRDIYVINHRFDLDYNNTQNLFMHVLFGAVYLHKYKLRNKPELIEIKQKYNDDEWGYTYALYSPVRGTIWDSSHWLFFYELIGESSIDPSFFKMQLEIFLKILKKDIIFHKYVLDKNLLKNFIASEDLLTRQKNIEAEKLKTFTGLLTEFLAAYYVLKENGVNIDIHKDISSTDIDVLFENNEKRVIFQVKTSLTFQNKENKKILNYFNTIQSEFNDDKPIEKILFFAEEKVGDYYPLLDEKGSVAPNDIENRKKEIIEIFSENNIRVIFLKSFIDKLKQEKSYGDLISKLKTIYNIDNNNNANLSELI